MKVSEQTQKPPTELSPKATEIITRQPTVILRVSFLILLLLTLATLSVLLFLGDLGFDGERWKEWLFGVADSMK